MLTFHAEYSKLTGYSIHIKLQDSAPSKITITPSPESLFIQLGEKVFKINTIVPVLSLQDSICEQDSNWIYIKIPANPISGFEVKFKKEESAEIQNVACKTCGQTLVSGFEASFPMPSTNWETLSELWSCHPSHEQVYSVEVRKKSCYISLFYVHFMLDTLNNTLIVDNDKVNCGQCASTVGVSAVEIMLFRHKVIAGSNVSFAYLVEQALLERINEINRDLHIGYIQIRLLSWENHIYYKGSFTRCFSVLYKKAVYKGSDLPEEDLAAMLKSLKHFNMKLPESSRKFNEWKLSYILFDLHN